MSNIGNVAASMENLKDILAAIMEHDKDKARTAMETHIREFRKIIMHIL